MKKLSFLLVIFYVTTAYSQSLNFNYDASGNQILRVIDLSKSGNIDNQDYVNAKDITDENLVRSDEIDGIRYYPNPVSQFLYIDWSQVEENISELVLMAPSGQVISKYSVERKQNEIINMEAYPVGLYTLLIRFGSDRKSLKILKK